MTQPNIVILLNITICDTSYILLFAFPYTRRGAFSSRFLAATTPTTNTYIGWTLQLMRIDKAGEIAPDQFWKL